MDFPIRARFSGVAFATVPATWRNINDLFDSILDARRLAKWEIWLPGGLVLMPELAIVFVGCERGMRLALSLTFELGSRLRDREPCVILRVAFVTRAALGNLLDDFFGIVALGKGAFGESPIMFGLA
jgi:hypothetical protein